VSGKRIYKTISHFSNFPAYSTPPFLFFPVFHSLFIRFRIQNDDNIKEHIIIIIISSIAASQHSFSSRSIVTISAHPSANHFFGVWKPPSKSHPGRWKNLFVRLDQDNPSGHCLADVQFITRQF
jgi:hypothetical protein